jgi:hypothetical protein
MAVGTPAPAPTPDPLAGTGVTAAIRDQQHTGWIFHHLQISVEVVNHDPTSHSGFLVATFTLPNGSTQLAYQDLSLNPGDAQMVTLTSDGNAQSAVVTFRQTML